MDITYQEIQPSTALQPFVDCYWVQSFSNTDGETSPLQRCPPFGTVELIVHMEDNHCEVLFDDHWQKLPKMFLAGMYRDAVIWRSPGNTKKFGIRLKPEALHQLFKLPAAALYNNYTAVENLDLKQAAAFAENLSMSPTINDAVAKAEDYLKGRLLRNRLESNYFIEAANLMRSAKGAITIEEVSSKLAVSPRQLQRVFKDQVGTSPKTFGRIIRFSNAYRQMQYLEQAGGWAGLSYLLGYSDQAHFIREFKEFSGLIPNVMLNDEGQMFGKISLAV